MAEGGRAPIENGIGEEGLVTSPVISPLVRELNSDQLMKIAEDDVIFQQVLNQMEKHKKCGEICNCGVISPNQGIFAHSTPLRPLPGSSGGTGFSMRHSFLESRKKSPCIGHLEVPNEEALNHKKYLMVIQFLSSFEKYHQDDHYMKIVSSII